MIKTITALQNPLIKAINSLKNSKNRSKNGQFVAEGHNTIKTLLQTNSNLNLVNLICTSKTLNLAQNLAQNDQIILVNDLIMAKISTNSTPAELFAVLQKPKNSPEIVNLTTGCVLAQIADPGNMGTLIRTTAAMGFKTCVVVEGCDPWGPKVVQASAGTIGFINIVELSWPELLIQAKKASLELCALVVHAGQKPTDLDLNNTLIVVGNEANGLPESWVNDCQQKLTLPMPGNTESLNAAVAGSIALYLAGQKNSQTA